MSWSVQAQGSPAKVKEVVNKSFEVAKTNTARIPAEQAAVTNIASIVNDHIDFCLANGVKAIEVKASGSASTQSSPEYAGSIQATFEFKSLYGNWD